MTKPTNHLYWLRSSRCGNSSCVEVARDGELIRVRDTKRPGGAELEFTRSEWDAFLAGARNGEFDFA